MTCHLLKRARHDRSRARHNAAYPVSFAKCVASRRHAADDGGPPRGAEGSPSSAPNLFIAFDLRRRLQQRTGVAGVAAGRVRPGLAHDVHTQRWGLGNLATARTAASPTDFPLSVSARRASREYRDKSQVRRGSKTRSAGLLSGAAVYEMHSAAGSPPSPFLQGVQPPRPHSATRAEQADEGGGTTLP